MTEIHEIRALFDLIRRDIGKSIALIEKVTDVFPSSSTEIEASIGGTVSGADRAAISALVGAGKPASDAKAALRAALSEIDSAELILGPI